ncbi:phage tail protein [Rugamonas sp. DEMB1]|uniref:phage tail protein n=1 Tax=Rugamonas sp. DEMB1 TaxID=3039386 RepID=UPI00244975D4|nr:tail fiber protein [Rugamonas sp. DEMB1]WGG50411.1 tail fiber protein [Rugamonas sp. DEMB1]
MADPYIGEIRMFAGNFAPNGWMFCNGAVLSIAENDMLFSLITTTYGGDGQTTFALPDLRGRLPVASGTDRSGRTYNLGQAGGVEDVTLSTGQMPAHTHALAASSDRATPAAGATTGLLANTGGSLLYAHPASPAPMRDNAISSAGGSMPHSNMAPYLCVSFIIAVSGMYPQQA